MKGAALVAKLTTYLMAIAPYLVIAVAVVVTAYFAYVGIRYAVKKFSKGGKQRIRDTELGNLSNDEIDRLYKDPKTSKSLKQRLKKEQKARGGRNQQKRGKKK